MSADNESNFHILIVDDDPGDVELIKLALQEARLLCTASVANNGEEAMAFLRQQPPYADQPVPDLVLLDLNMPRKNGKEVLAEMKDDLGLSTIPVVVLTTSDTERDVVASYQLGAAGYVVKPVDIDELINIIRGIGNYWFSVVRLPA
ncbi:MAG TPA: response regulator [Rhodospirillaceae bacterium]|nr:response regulator [Rhodospirillaceae bacterium]